MESLISKGKLSAKRFNRATGLLELDRGKTLVAVAETLGVSYVTVSAWRDGYKEQGLECLGDAPRSGRPPEIDGRLRAKITTLACSEPPEGHARWSWRLLADKVVELGYCEEIYSTYIGSILKKTNRNRTLAKRGGLVRSMRGFWIIGVEAHHGNPYDGVTLKASINQTERLTGVRPKEAFVDRDYRGKEHHPENVKIHITGQQKVRGALKAFQMMEHD